MKKNQTIKEMAYELLKEKGEPLNYNELTKLIMQKREIQGKTPRNTVNSILCRNPMFKKIGKGKTGIFGLSEWKSKEDKKYKNIL